MKSMGSIISILEINSDQIKVICRWAGVNMEEIMKLAAGNYPFTNWQVIDIFQLNLVRRSCTDEIISHSKLEQPKYLQKVVGIRREVFDQLKVSLSINWQVLPNCQLPDVFNGDFSLLALVTRS